MLIINLRLHLSTYLLSNEISICLNDLLDDGPDPEASPLDVLHGDPGKHLLDDGSDDGVLGVMIVPLHWCPSQPCNLQKSLGSQNKQWLCLP